MQNNEWQEFFDGHAPVYMENIFTKNTKAEVEFLVAELGLKPGARILDIGCGSGRHAIELAKRGYAMAGIDISEGMLQEARKAAEEAGVAAEFVQADASRYTPKQVFDGAICLCEGAFGLLGSGDDPMEHDLAILGNIFNALKSGGRFVTTVLNALGMLRRCTSGEHYRKATFDPQTLTVTHKFDIGGQEIDLRERGFTIPELKVSLQLAGFEVECIGGGTAGNWGKRPLELDEFEIMAIARKPD